MNRFVAIATEYNVLNVVALRALAQPGDAVAIVDDPHSRQHGRGQRLHEVVQGRLGMPVATVTTAGWGLDQLIPAVDAAFAPLADAARTGALHLLLIGGRKHDTLVLHELLRERAAGQRIPLFVHSVDRRPFRLSTSGYENGQRFYREQPLSELPDDKAIRLDEVLAVHGYKRTKGDALTFGGALPSRRGGATGESFERQVAELVRSSLGERFRPLMSQIWLGVEIAPERGGKISTELDLLLLARDGSAVHFECKTGGSGGAKELQSKLFQLRRAFTPESSMVLCKPADAAKPQSVKDAYKGLLDQYQALGAFGVLLYDPRQGSRQSMGGLGSAKQLLHTALRGIWSAPADA